MTYCSDTATPYIIRIQWGDRKNASFPWKVDLGIAKNFCDRTNTSITAEIYNALRLNSIKPEIEKILRDNQDGLLRKRSITSHISHPSNQRCSYKKPRGDTVIPRFFQSI